MRIAPSLIRLLILQFAICSPLAVYAKVIAHWDFDQPAGPAGYTDSSGSNHTLQEVEAPKHITEGQKFGKGALLFNSLEKDSLLLKGTSSNGALRLNRRSFSISFWVKRNRLGEQWIIAQGNPIETPQVLTSRILHIGFRNSSGKGGYPANAMNLGFYTNDLHHELTPTDVKQWHHYVMTYNASTKTQRIIIDGDIKKSVTRVAPRHFLGGGTNPFTIGHRYENQFYFDGILDELWVFDTALTAAQNSVCKFV